MKILGLKAEELLFHDGIPLSGEAGGNASVLFDENGVPLEWTLLRTGKNELIKNGVSGTLVLSADDMDSIMDYFTRKGEDIPVDSNHYLHELANRKRMDESEILKILPSGVAAMGYGSLALSGNELRFRVKWTPTAYKLMKEKIFKYFSPAIRGLVRPPLRITSVAMENEPAINNLDALAASANQVSDNSNQSDGKGSMNKLEKALMRLTGRDSIALEGEGSEKEKERIASEINGKAALLEEIRSLMGLAENAGAQEIAAALKAILEKAASADDAQAKLDELAAGAEKAEHARLIALGRAQGKITNALETWVESLDSKALSAWLSRAPVAVRTERITQDAHRQEDRIPLSADEEKIVRILRLKADDYIRELRSTKI